MRTALIAIAFILLTLCPRAQAAVPTFKGEEIDKSLEIGYAVTLVDLNADGRRDIVVVDKLRIIWFENPTWKLRTILQGQTKPDNVCVDAADIDGDGQLDLAIGAGWRPPNTKDAGTLQWLKRGKTLDDQWTMYPIGEEPSIHRIRFADLDKDGKPELLSAPLQGAGSTPQKNWAENGVRLTAHRVPADPTKGPWPFDVLDSSMHAMHNIAPVDLNEDGQLDILTASYEGVGLVTRKSGQWTRLQLGEGNQEKPSSNRGSSEIKLGKLKNGKKYIATIEPWHGNQTVVYTPQSDVLNPWKRQVIDEQLKWGHAVSCADLDGDGSEELIIGVRDPLNEKVRSGVNVFTSNDGENWTKQTIDNGGIAVEDLAVADLDNDNKPDIVAVGRATKNVKIYWNK